jgi:hypothetical protein
VVRCLCFAVSVVRSLGGGQQRQGQEGHSRFWKGHWQPKDSCVDETRSSCLCQAHVATSSWVTWCPGGTPRSLSLLGGNVNKVLLPQITLTSTKAPRRLLWWWWLFWTFFFSYEAKSGTVHT